MDNPTVSDMAPAPMIGAESMTPAVSPAPMMGIPSPAAGRAAFPGAIQRSSNGSMQDAAGDFRTYNEPAPGPGGMKASDLKDAMAIVQSAMRFQGARGLSQDLQSGMAPEQALLKNGDKLFAGHESQLASALMKGQAEKEPSMNSVMGVPVLHPTTHEPIPNLVAIPGKGGAIHVENLNSRGTSAEDQLSKEARASTRKVIMAELEPLLKNMPPATSARFPVAQQRANELRQQLEALTASAGATKTDLKTKHKAEGLQHLKDFPNKAEAIKQRFKQTYGEDLVE